MKDVLKRFASLVQTVHRNPPFAGLNRWIY